MSTAITVFTGQSSAADTAAAALDASATESANAASESSSIVTDHQDAASPLQLGTASPTTGDNAIPAEPAGVDGDAAVPTTMPEESVPEDVSAGQSTHEQTAGSTQLDTAVQEAAPENPIADDSQSVLAPNAAAVAETDTASKDPVSAAAATDATAVSSSAVSTADSMHNAALQSVSPMNVADQATLSNQADMPKSAVALQQASDDASASTGAQGSSEQIGASDGSAASTEGSSPSPDLTCRQAFAALQYATGKV